MGTDEPCLKLRWNMRSSHYGHLESARGVILGTVTNVYRPETDNFRWHATHYGYNGLDFFDDIEEAKRFVERRLGVEQ